MKGVAALVFLALCLGWAIYFWTHMGEVCQWPMMVGTRECVGYNIGRMGNR